MDKNSRFEMAYKFCSLLKNETIKEEIQSNLIDGRNKLIEEKVGKKVKSDYKLFIDRIPMDEEYIVTKEQKNKLIDEVT